MIMMSMMKYIFMAAKRDKLVLSLFLMMIISSCMAVFLGSAAVIEKNLFVLVFSAGILRIVTVLGLVLFVTFYMRRAFDSKEVDYLLSRPLSRVTFIASHVLSFSIMACFAGGVAGISLYTIAPQSFAEGHLLWIFSLMAELVIMVNAAFFFAMVLKSASASALTCLAFYALARIMGQILGILDVNTGISDWEFINYTMRFIGMVMPRLDLMGQTSWLIYGIAENSVSAIFIAGQALLCTGLLATASYLDLFRRQF
jgi:hypothetical protein